MERNAHYAAIGLATLVLFLGLILFAVWLARFQFAKEYDQYDIVFYGPVRGLSEGGEVHFNGIKVGEVTGLALNPSKPQQVTATVSMDKTVQVRTDTEIGLEFQGLTGIAALSLKGGDPNAPVVVSEKDQPPPVLTAPPGATQDITQSARDVLRRLEEFLVTNQQSFKNALNNIEKFTATLAQNSEHIDNTLASIDKFSSALGRNSDNIDSTLASIEKFSSALGRNSERIDRIAAGIEGLTGGPDGKGGEINEAARSIRQLADRLDQRTAEITTGINRLSGTGARQIEALSADARRTLAEIDRAVRNFDRNPSRLLFGGGGSGSLPEYNGRR